MIMNPSSPRNGQQYLPRDGRGRHRRGTYCSPSLTFVVCTVGIVCMHLLQLLSLHVLEKSYQRFADNAAYKDATKTNISGIPNMMEEVSGQQTQHNHNNEVRPPNTNIHNSNEISPLSHSTSLHASDDQNSSVPSIVDHYESQRDVHYVSRPGESMNIPTIPAIRDSSPMEENIDDTDRDVQFWETKMNDKPILIVGGSDGSGTRGFVDTLHGFLNVDFVVDDPTTLDVHGTIMFHGRGWPTLIERTVGVTHTANYELDDLPGIDETATILSHVDAFLTSLRSKYISKKRQDLKLRAKRALRNVTTTNDEVEGADDVSFAFKAPVAMLVLPVLAKVIGRRFKFIHVIRDGRDVALSDNQSPTIKFYNVTYPDYNKRAEIYQGTLYNVRAMQLWNDWNMQAQEWALSHPEQIDYLMMRTEDLMVGSPSKRFECLMALSNFVGSPRTTEEICCHSRLEVKDHGKSTVYSEGHNIIRPSRQEIEKMKRDATSAVESAERLLEFFSHNPDHALFAGDGKFDPDKVKELIQQTEEKADGLIPEDYEYAPVDFVESNQNAGDTTIPEKVSESVKKRYGKWEEILANNTALAEHFYKEGEVGLSVFGYHPYREIQYLSSTASWCDATVSCP